jgi:predicted small lipoprotein YifL
MHCWARYLFIIVVAVLATGQMIAACGQKGDLYLPEPEPQEQKKPAPPRQDAAVPEVETGESLEVEEDVSGAKSIGKESGE